MGDFSRLSDASRLGNGCGALRLGGVGVKWESWARKVGGELGGACQRGGVDGATALCDERGGGVDRGYLEFRACELRVYALYIIFYVQRY